MNHPGSGRSNRLVVAGMNAEGRSVVLSSTELPDDRVVNVWNDNTDAVLDTIARLAPGDIAEKVEPARGPGGFRLVLNRIPPPREAPDWGYRSQGMHTTRTIDFDYVISGTVECVLDEEVVELHAGDFIILEAARHEWRNPTDEWVVKLALLHRPTRADGDS